MHYSAVLQLAGLILGVPTNQFVLRPGTEEEHHFMGRYRSVTEYASQIGLPITDRFNNIRVFCGISALALERLQQGEFPMNRDAGPPYNVRSIGMLSSADAPGNRNRRIIAGAYSWLQNGAFLAVFTEGA